MKKMLKKFLSVLIVAGMTVALTACGGTKDSGKTGSDNGAEDGKKYYSAQYLENLPDSMNGNGSNSVSLCGDRVYYSTYNDDYTKQTIYSFDILTGENVEYLSVDNSNSGDLFAERMSLDRFVPDNEGNLYLLMLSNQVDESTVDKTKYENTTREDVIDYIYNNWGFGTYEEAEEYFTTNEADFMQNGYTYGSLLMQYELTEANYIRHMYIKKYDTSGNEISNMEITSYTGNGYCDALGIDAEGYVYLALEEYTDTSSSSYILVNDKDGNNVGKIDTQYVSRFVSLKDGSCGYLSWGTEGDSYSLSVLDGATAKVSEEISLGSSYVDKCIQIDDHTFMYKDDRSLSTYDLETQESHEYLKWMDCNISSNYVSDFGILSDGRVVAYIQSYDSNGTNVDIAILNEVSAEEANSVNQINVACFTMDYNMENAAIEFNKKNSDYHINISPYYDWNSDVDYQDAINSFMTSISSDTSIDVVCFYDYSQMLNFASKGLLIDLYELMKSDGEVNKDTIMPNIISACEYDGKLVALPTSFNVQTLVGKVSDVGTTPGWTVADLKALYETKEPGTKILNYSTKQDAFNMCLSLGYNQFIDLENRTCNFDSQEFVDVLEFASLFPDEYQYDEGEDETELMNKGKILLYQTNIPDFGQMQMLSTIFGDDLTYIGYPTQSGNGCMMYLYGLTGITKYCDAPDVVWDFLSKMYVPDPDNNYGGYFNGSILKSEFDKYFDGARNEEYYQGSWSWGNFETQLHVPEQAEVDAVKDIILNTTAVSGAVSNDILNIIKEEAEAYFSNQKSAQDVAAIIQSRMSIYLSETE